jgi:hypothetical protein
MLEALRALVRLRFCHVNTETRAGQGFAESFFIGRGPERDAATGLQGRRDSFESAAAIEP